MMEYKPALPRKNDNVSHDRPVREFILLFSGITLFLLALFWVSGLLVDRAVNYISPEMEGKIFSAFSPSGKEAVRDSDPQPAELQSMVKALSPCIHITYPLRVYLIDSRTANAMALPGGRILVFKGLLDKVKSENGLAFVLAHELAHFKNRDHLRGMGRGILITAAAALITGAGSDLTRFFTPAVNLNTAHYSQTREGLADEKALEVLDCFYGHVGGASEFFNAMAPGDKEKYNLIGHYFSSHPEAVERIKNLQELADESGFPVQAVKPLPGVFKKK